MKKYSVKNKILSITISDEFTDASDKYKLVHKRGDLRFPRLPFIKSIYKENVYIDMSNKHRYTYEGIRKRFWNTYGKYYKAQFEMYYVVDKTCKIMRKPHVIVKKYDPLMEYTWNFESISNLNNFVKNNKEIQDFINYQSK